MNEVALLKQVLPYLRHHKKSTMVVKLGGEIAANREALRSLAEDVSLLTHVGIRIVLVHGGGPQATEMQKRLGLEPEPATAILAWAVVGCLDYQRDGFGTCKAVERSTADYRAEMDLLGAFFEEALKFEPGSSVSRKTLREVYERWCREAGVKVLVGAKDFGERLRARGASDSKREGTRFWCGVRLLDADEESETDGARGSSGQAFSESPSKPFLVKETSRETPAPAAPLPRPRARQISLDPDSGELVEVEL